MSNSNLSKKELNTTSIAGWSESITQINQQEKSIIDAKHDHYRWLSKELQLIFKKHLGKDVKIIYCFDGSMIKVEVPVFINESLRLSSDFLDELCMPVAVHYDNDRKIIFELYTDVYSEEFSSNIMDISVKSDENLSGIDIESETETISDILKEGGM